MLARLADQSREGLTARDVRHSTRSRTSCGARSGGRWCGRATALPRTARRSGWPGLSFPAVRRVSPNAAMSRAADALRNAAGAAECRHYRTRRCSCGSVRPQPRSARAAQQHLRRRGRSAIPPADQERRTPHGCVRFSQRRARQVRPRAPECGATEPARVRPARARCVRRKRRRGKDSGTCAGPGRCRPCSQRGCRHARTRRTSGRSGGRAARPCRCRAASLRVRRRRGRPRPPPAVRQSPARSPRPGSPPAVGPPRGLPVGGRVKRAARAADPPSPATAATATACASSVRRSGRASAPAEARRARTASSDSSPPSPKNASGSQHTRKTMSEP